MSPGLTLIAVLLWASQPAALAINELLIDPPVPGLAASEHYKVRLRPAKDGGEWRSAFAWETACKTVDKKTDAYFDTLAGWTHAYVNFETAGAVEVEIARIRDLTFENLTLAGKPVREAEYFKTNEFVHGLHFAPGAASKPSIRPKR